MDLFRKSVALFLVLCTLFLLSACALDGMVNESGSHVDSDSLEDEKNTDNKDNSEDEKNTDNKDNYQNDEIQDIVSTVKLLSYNPEDYIGDLETFVYGLLINELEYIYDVFPACVQLSDSYFVYGLAYTDYTECYTNEDESVAYFMSGFLPFVGELDIPDEDFESGLYIYDLEYEDESTQFVWKYRSDAFLQHCVVYGAYLQYGVDENGYITYNAAPFEREKCDTSLGALYSYDDSRYLYDVDFGNYTPISGISLAVDIDYAELEREINAVIAEQNANFMTYDIETVAYTSQDAVVSFLLSMQEETFLGYSVDLLVEAAKELNPLECFRITTDGLSVVDISEIPPEEPTALCKWLVGTACVIVTAVGIVASMVFVACPPLSALAGAVTGAAIETFMQVVIDNRTLGDVSWEKVAIAACAGAISGFIGPYIQTLSGASYFLIDSAVDGIIGATEQAIFAWMDGKSGKEVLSSFGYGFALGAGLSAAFKVVGKLASKGVEGLSALAEKASKKLPPKLTATATKFVKPIKDFGSSIGNSIKKMQRKVDSTIFHSNYISKKLLQKNMTMITKSEKDELFEMSFGRGTMSAEKIVDGNGNYYTKSSLSVAAKNAKNGDVIGFIEEQGYKIPVVKYGDAYSISPQEHFVTVTPKNKQYNKYTAQEIRKENLNGARGLLRDYFVNNPNEIPSSLEKAIKETFTDMDVVDALKTMSPSSLKKVLETGGALHENLDGTVTYMPKEIHAKISHMGGAAYEAYLKQHMGKIYFETFISSAASGAVVGGVYE